MDQAEGPEWTEFGPLPEGWYPTEDDRERAGLEHPLGRELAPGHQLEGLKVRAVASCARCDDVLYLVDKIDFAVVHLTWSRQRETDPYFPRTRMFPSWSAFVQSQDGYHG